MPIADTDDILSQVLWRVVVAKAQARRGAAEASMATALEAVDLASSTLDVELQADALTDLAEVHRILGQQDDSRIRLTEALALYQRKGDVVLARALGEELAASTPA